MTPGTYFLTRQNVRIPMILYGTAWKKERTAEWVERAITLGFRGIDTACQPKHYNEPGVGEGIAACEKRGLIKRDELYLQTKFTPRDGHDPLRIPYDPATNLSEQVAQSFQVSVTNLQTGYLDGLVLHSPLAAMEQTMEVWQAMEKLVRMGYVKQLGISNCYNLKQLQSVYDAAAVKPAVLQNRFYAQTGYDRELRAFCSEQGMIYQSFWTLTANPQILNHAGLQKLAAHYLRTPEQVFFRYLTQTGIVPLTGTTSETHMREDLAIFEFELSAEDRAVIEPLIND